MRILYLHQYFNSASMPGSTRSYELARRLVSRGHEVHMVSAWREPMDDKDWLTTCEDGIVVHWLPVPYSNSMGYGQRIIAFFRFAFHAARKSSSLPADVVFATSTPLTIALPGAYAAWRQRVPMVLEVRDLWPEIPIAIGALRNPVTRRLGKILEQFAYHNAARIITLSPGMRDGIKECGYPPERITVVPNGVDLRLFFPDKARAARTRQGYPELGEGPIILYAGTVGKVNGLEYMVRLAAESSHMCPAFRFVMIGAGGEWRLVETLARELGVLNKNVFMYPTMPKSQLADIFAAAAVTTSFVIDLPELEANSANKFFEGLAAGVPMLLNYGGWQAQLLAETKSGMRLSRDIHAASRQLNMLISDQQLCRRMGQNARRLAEERFSYDYLAGLLEDVLNSAIA